MKIQIYIFVLAMLIPLAVSAKSSESERIKGVADFLVDRAAENALYLYEGRVKSNKFFRVLFPRTCTLLKDGSLRQLLYSEGVWEDTVISDIRTTFKVVAVMYIVDKFLYLDYLDKTEAYETSISELDPIIKHVLDGYYIYEDLDSDEISDIKTYLYFSNTLQESYGYIGRLTAGVDDQYNKLRQYLIDSEYEGDSSGLEECSSVVDIYDMTDKLGLIRDEINIIAYDIKKSIRGLGALINILREHMDDPDHGSHISSEKYRKVMNILVGKKKALQSFIDEFTTILALTSDSIYDEFMIRADVLSDDIHRQAVRDTRRAVRDTYKSEALWYRRKGQEIDKIKIKDAENEEKEILKQIAQKLELMSELGKITGDNSGVLVREKIDETRKLSKLIVKIKSRNARKKVKVLVSNIKKKIEDDGRNVFGYAVLAERYLDRFISKNEKYKRECKFMDFIFFSGVDTVELNSDEYYERYSKGSFSKDGEKYLESYQGDNVCVRSYARGTYARFKKAMFLFAQLADAETGEELKELLEIATLPPVSFGVKRTPGETHLMVSSYLGYSFALNYDDLVDKDTRHSLSVPLGVEWSRGCSNGGRWYDIASYCSNGSLNFMVAPFDLAVPVNLLFEDSDDDVELKDIISPGAYLSYGFKSMPVVVGLGYSKGRALNGVDKEKEERFVLFLSFDMPLFTLY